jgi:hypothetical protein
MGAQVPKIMDGSLYTAFCERLMFGVEYQTARRYIPGSKSSVTSNSPTLEKINTVLQKYQTGVSENSVNINP